MFEDRRKREEAEQPPRPVEQPISPIVRPYSFVTKTPRTDAAVGPELSMKSPRKVTRTPRTGTKI